MQPAHPASTLGGALRETVATLESAGVDDARRTAEWLLEALVGCSRARLYAYPETPLGDAQRATLARWVARRQAGEPVQYIVGAAAFCGLDLIVTPAVLIPRPETEEVVAAALETIAGRAAPRVLDAGTGSGAIALALKNARPDADVWALDVSPEALAVAAQNAAHLGLDVHLVCADLLAPRLDGVEGPFDLLVSNPPYIPDAERPELAYHVRAFEPRLALFSGAEPFVFYHALARHACRLVPPGGAVVAETHADYAGGAAACFAPPHFTEVKVRRDLHGRPRVAMARRV